MTGNNTYVLITPARNEEAHIEKTIQSVIAQTILPKKWVIVSDGSTDRTDEIARQYASKHNFIQYIRATGYGQRTFRSKFNAFNIGHEQLRGIEYEFLGVLDGDVSFDPYYYKNVLAKFQHNQELGIAGGVRYDLCDGKFQRVWCARNSVGGPFQLFRRQCYEDIGGYIPTAGGSDAIAEIMARMHGWETESFPDITVYHHRCTGTATGGFFKARFREGIKNYQIGCHPLFGIAKSLSRMKERPYVIGSLLWMSGYFWASFRRYERPVPDNFVKYLREEQLARLRLFFSSDRALTFRI